jgi:hypothetical protein
MIFTITVTVPESEGKGNPTTETNAATKLADAAR